MTKLNNTQEGIGTKLSHILELLFKLKYMPNDYPELKAIKDDIKQTEEGIKSHINDLHMHIDKLVKDDPNNPQETL